MLNTFPTVLLENKNVMELKDCSPGEQPQYKKDSNCPEARLILACSQTIISPVVSAQIKELLQEELDWEYIIKTAQLNGVTPLLCHHLLNIYPEFIPERFQQWLKGFSEKHTKNNLFQMMELIKIIRILDKNNIPSLPLKGPTLAALAYGNFSLRQFCDLDILVPKKDVSRCINLLAEIGYNLSSSPSWLERLPTLISRKKDFALVNESRSVRIELHWRLSGTHFDLPLKTPTMWPSLKKVALAGYSVRILSLNDLLLYLTMHGSRHGWMRLAWICDIAELIKLNHHSMDWKWLAGQARTLGCERTLNLGLFLANSLLSASLPKEVLDDIKSDAAIINISSQVRESLFIEEQSPHDILYWSKYHVEMKERFRERFRVRMHYFYRYFHIAITPNEKDEFIMHLPHYLHFIYYFLRPLRLIRKFGMQLLKPGKKDTSRS